MVIFDLLMVLTHGRAVLKYATVIHGGAFVMMAGMVMTHVWFAGNLDSTHKVDKRNCISEKELDG